MSVSSQVTHYDCLEPEDSCIRHLHTEKLLGVDKTHVCGMGLQSLKLHSHWELWSVWSQ